MVVRVCEVDVNLDRLRPGEIPSLHQCVVMDVEILALHLDGATIWLRRDQANELVNRLVVHLPSEKEAA